MLGSLSNFFSKLFGVSISDADKDTDENFLSPKHKSEEMDLSSLKFTVPNTTKISLDGGDGGSFDFQGDYDKLRELVNQANEFWMIELSASSNSFFLCHIVHNIDDSVDQATTGYGTSFKKYSYALTDNNQNASSMVLGDLA